MTTELPDSPVLEIEVNEKHRPGEITSLHQQALMHTAGIDEDKSPCLLLNGKKVTCTEELKIFEDCALLHSVSLVKENQGKNFDRVLSTADLWNIHRQRIVRVQRRYI